MSNQLKEQKESIDKKVAFMIKDLDTYGTVKTIRNWLKSDIQNSQELVTMFNNYLERDENNESTESTLDAKKYYEHIEQLRYTISIMEQAIIES